MKLKFIKPASSDPNAFHFQNFLFDLCKRSKSELLYTTGIVENLHFWWVKTFRVEQWISIHISIFNFSINISSWNSAWLDYLTEENASEGKLHVIWKTFFRNRSLTKAKTFFFLVSSEKPSELFPQNRRKQAMSVNSTFVLFIVFPSGRFYSARFIPGRTARPFLHYENFLCIDVITFVPTSLM